MVRLWAALAYFSPGPGEGTRPGGGKRERGPRPGGGKRESETRREDLGELEVNGTEMKDAERVMKAQSTSRAIMGVGMGWGWDGRGGEGRLSQDASVRWRVM